MPIFLLIAGSLRPIRLAHLSLLLLSFDTMHGASPGQNGCEQTIPCNRPRQGSDAKNISSQNATLHRDPPDNGAMRALLLPIKDLRNSKQRLAHVLSPGERFALAQAMLD